MTTTLTPVTELKAGNLIGSLMVVSVAPHAEANFLAVRVVNEVNQPQTLALHKNAAVHVG